MQPERQGQDCDSVFPTDSYQIFFQHLRIRPYSLASNGGYFQKAKERFVPVPFSTADPAKSVAHFLICFAKSDRDPIAMGLPVFIAMISSSELFGMLMDTGRRTASEISFKATSPRERERLMSTFTLPAGRLYCSNRSTYRDRSRSAGTSGVATR